MGGQEKVADFLPFCADFLTVFGGFSAIAFFADFQGHLSG
jgi:hypothetical protein